MTDPEVLIDGRRYVRADRVHVVGRLSVLSQLYRMFWGEPEDEATMLRKMEGVYVQVKDEPPRRGQCSVVSVADFLRLSESP